MPFNGIPYLRTPDEETEDYPGIVVNDGRVTGSITTGRTRLPIWAIVPELVAAGFERADGEFDIKSTGLTQDGLNCFLVHLLNARGDFGRLLCVLADVERRDGEASENGSDSPWWEQKESVERVRAALLRCLSSLPDDP